MASKKGKKTQTEYIKTGISGLDALLGEGIPKGTSVLLCGGTGTGKTILALNIIYNQAQKGKDCIYLSFEESAERLEQHMKAFGMDPEDTKGKLLIERVESSSVERMVDTMVTKSSPELKIDIQEGILGIIPKDFKPDYVVVDSLSAISAVFTGDKNYRIYAQQLFRYFENLGATTFMISEHEQSFDKYSRSGVEEFLADGIIVLYYLKSGSVRERAIEVLKLRGGKHQEKIAAMDIGEKGIIVYPDQPVFEGEE